ncbi:hypothetical protein AVEN_118308-1 [Araneus ventricosus]|uniref:Uncharacterized protein n=1 Tax=Araneus ventricosus TaxID=182803 RepID=A0A4Y2WC18_ARAVE|nr:hypothetical protein AVEN_236931-1 [Araneus ventricosus]GBO34079.1 hypothetical protein AVEN_118308-1 [Araneus ventricosus]
MPPLNPHECYSWPEILNHSQMTRATPEQASHFHTTIEDGRLTSTDEPCKTAIILELPDINFVHLTSICAIARCLLAFYILECSSLRRSISALK